PAPTRAHAPVLRRSTCLRWTGARQTREPAAGPRAPGSFRNLCTLWLGSEAGGASPRTQGGKCISRFRKRKGNLRAQTGITISSLLGFFLTLTRDQKEICREWWGRREKLRERSHRTKQDHIWTLASGEESKEDGVAVVVLGRSLVKPRTKAKKGVWIFGNAPCLGWQGNCYQTANR
ncbi:hypothetical protein U0070_008932, partial [Myodes glareolus]